MREWLPITAMTLNPEREAIVAVGDKQQIAA